MSDDENEEQPSVAFHILGGPSAEQIEQYRLHMQANAHDSVRIFDELSEDHLLRMRGIFQAIQQDPETIGYFIGVASSHLKFRFKYCMACGVNHDAELEKLAGDGGPDGQPIPEVVDLIEKEAADDLDGPWTHLMMDKETYERVCDLHYVDWTDDGTVRCKGCQTIYPNLPDRMRRKTGKEGCDNCNQKEKWG